MEVRWEILASAELARAYYLRRSRYRYHDHRRSSLMQKHAEKESTENAMETNPRWSVVVGGPGDWRRSENVAELAARGLGGFRLDCVLWNTRGGYAYVISVKRISRHLDGCLVS